MNTEQRRDHTTIITVMVTRPVGLASFQCPRRLSVLEAT
jgi:hypothetical protein